MYCQPSAATGQKMTFGPRSHDRKLVYLMSDTMDQPSFMDPKIEILDISAVRHWNDLSTLMVDQVKQILYFDTFSILMVDSNREWYRKVAGMASGTVFFQHLPYKDSLIEHNVNLIEATGEPLLFKFSQDFSRFRDKNIINNLKNFGQRQSIVTILKVGALLTGVVSLDSYKDDRYNKSHFSVFQSIACQVALAMNQCA
jgi:formate hydrogenlyase transcriptional activator